MEIRKYYQKIKNVLGISLQLAKAEFKLRNEGSYLGIFWYLLNPILTFALLLFVFNDRLGSGIKYYMLYLLLGVIMFNFFQNATIDACKAIKDNNYIIKSINFPTESLVIAIVLKNLFSHLFEILLFSIIFAFSGLYWANILYYLIILLFLVFFILGSSLVLSSLTVIFFDLDNLWIFGVRMLWLATPIFYSIGGQAKLFYFNILNPLYYFITVARDLIIYGQMPPNWMIYGLILFSFVFLAIGWLVFRFLKNKFAELI